MRIAYYTKQFKKDIKLVHKRRKDTENLRSVLSLLIEGHRLPEKCQDHPLKGKFAGYHECHLEPDWLLVYKVVSSEIYFVRTGTHSDLFG